MKKILNIAFVLLMTTAPFAYSQVAHFENDQIDAQLTEQVSSLSAEQSQEVLFLNVSNLRSAEGSILVSIYNKEEGFPKHPEAAILKFKVSAATAVPQGDRFVLQIQSQSLPFGNYAIAIAHDENNNEKIDTGFLGIPKEGVGFSNNPNITFGPPSYQKSEFIFDADHSTAAIKMHYY